ncbi:MAG TPA: alpha/beta hydrolase [Bacteroidia bacterium]|jgi:pimeloyl-ACP methyl ester carboxylesterase
MRHTSFRNINIRYSDTGKGRALVLLHGFPESLHIWKEFSKELEKKFRVIAIDLPGFGETPAIGYAHSMDLMAECVKAVMDDIGYRKYVVVGHSMGGYVALAFAELFPKYVSGICLFHSSAIADSEEKKKDRLRGVEIVKKDQRHYVSGLIDKLFAPGNIPAFQKEIEALKEIAYRTPAAGIINALLGMKDRPDRQHVLKKAGFPVHFIIGKQDQVMPYDVLFPQTKLAPRGSSLVLEHTGHMGFYEAKEEAQNSLIKFSRKCFRNEKK